MSKVNQTYEVISAILGSIAISVACFAPVPMPLKVIFSSIGIFCVLDAINSNLTNIINRLPEPPIIQSAAEK
ncbi:MAG TPA: hypothetical protein VMC41_04435 [Candidatus Nanoarchaeia archaeon]|nr:hypothetical protein [Candidatus Nanoarchaeia archaeon]